jgi:hypothetical protein
MNWIVIGFELAVGVALAALVLWLAVGVIGWVVMHLEESREKEQEQERRARHLQLSAERDLSRAHWRPATSRSGSGETAKPSGWGWYFLAAVMLTLGAVVVVNGGDATLVFISAAVLGIAGIVDAKRMDLSQ